MESLLARAISDKQWQPVESTLNKLFHTLAVDEAHHISDGAIGLTYVDISMGYTMLYNICTDSRIDPSFIPVNVENIRNLYEVYNAGPRQPENKRLIHLALYGRILDYFDSKCKTMWLKITMIEADSTADQIGHYLTLFERYSALLESANRLFSFHQRHVFPRMKEQAIGMWFPPPELDIRTDGMEKEELIAAQRSYLGAHHFLKPGAQPNDYHWMHAAARAEAASDPNVVVVPVKIIALRSWRIYVAEPFLQWLDDCALEGHISTEIGSRLLDALKVIGMKRGSSIVRKLLHLVGSVGTA